MISSCLLAVLSEQCSACLHTMSRFESQQENAGGQDSTNDV